MYSGLHNPAPPTLPSLHVTTLALRGLRSQLLRTQLLSSSVYQGKTRKSRSLAISPCSPQDPASEHEANLFLPNSRLFAPRPLPVHLSRPCRSERRPSLGSSPPPTRPWSLR